MALSNDAIQLVNYSSDSDDSSSDDDDDKKVTINEEKEVRYLIPAPYIRQDPEENEEIKKEEKENELEMAKKRILFFEHEIIRLNNLLAINFDPSKRRRATFQYGCRTCQGFPKRVNCICPKYNQRRKKQKKSD